ncbi:MAG: hypothetical protein CGU28_03205 [Candidatus Dactylopiibacterium carminicum]|nr:MAG: hypothetical protein CGU28_03205 [Candidatus Dactylopiibacterium carminicum]
MEDKAKILDKIKKCMALAQSGNEHEAATALRQARALMESCGITQAEMLAIGVSEARARAGATEAPPRWEIQLAGHIANVLGCRLMFSGSLLSSFGYVPEWSFIGVYPANDVAQYAFEVLFRQASRARKQHIKDVLKRYKRSNKTRLADLFCEGWVQTAALQVAPLSGSVATEEALDAYTKVNHPETSTLDVRDRNAGRQFSNKEYASFTAGKDAGREAELNKGMGAASVPLMIGGA